MANFKINKRTTKNAKTRIFAPSNKKKVDDEFAGDESDINFEDIPTPIKEQKEMTTFERAVVMACSFIFAGMIVFVLSGYERISRAYADINTINDSIESVKLHISELNVSIECAVTIDQAEEAAIAAGMSYPTQSQILSSNGTVSSFISSTSSNGNQQDGNNADQNETSDSVTTEG